MSILLQREHVYLSSIMSWGCFVHFFKKIENQWESHDDFIIHHLNFFFTSHYYYFMVTKEEKERINTKFFDSWSPLLIFTMPRR